VKRFAAFAVVALVLGAMLVAGVSHMLDTRRANADARALSNLPERFVSALLDIEGASPETVIFQDGEDGWFELDQTALPDDLRIRMHGPRLIDAFAGGEHVPVYCGGTARPGKILWAIRDGQIARDTAFCNPRRMDLSALRPFASPVALQSVRLNRDDLLTLQAEMATDPLREQVSGPHALPDLTHRRQITLPLVWFHHDSEFFRHDFDAEIESMIQSLAGPDVSVQVRQKPALQLHLSLNVPDGTGRESQVFGAALRRGDDVILVEDWTLHAVDIIVECLPESCAALERLDLSNILTRSRDLPGLQAAMEAGIPSPFDYDETELTRYAGAAMLREETVTIGPMEDILYDLRFMTRQSSE